MIGAAADVISYFLQIQLILEEFLNTFQTLGNLMMSVLLKSGKY